MLLIEPKILTFWSSDTHFRITKLCLTPGRNLGGVGFTHEGQLHNPPGTPPHMFPAGYAQYWHSSCKAEAKPLAGHLLLRVIEDLCQAP